MFVVLYRSIADARNCPQMFYNGAIINLSFVRRSRIVYNNAIYDNYIQTHFIAIQPFR